MEEQARHKRPNPYTDNDAPRKVQEVKSLEEQSEDALIDISNFLADKQHREIVIAHLGAIPGSLKQILDFRKTVQDAIVSAKPISHHNIIKRFKDLLKFPEDGFRDSAEEMEGGQEAADQAIDMLKDELLWKLNNTMEYKTKFEAVLALHYVIEEVVGIPLHDVSEWSDGFRSGGFPEAVCEILMEIGDLFSASDIERLGIDLPGLVPSLELAQRFKLYGSCPWEGLSDFLALMSTKLPRSSPQQTSPKNPS